MAVRTKEELLTSIKGVLGDSTDDNALGIIEDVSDTYDEITGNGSKDWKAEAERIDKEWRQKYHDRFFNPKGDDDVDPLDHEHDNPKPLRFEDLFS